MTISEDALHKIVAWEDRKLADDVSLISGQHVMARDVNTRGEGVAYLTGPADFPHGTINQTKFTTRPTKMCQAGDILLTVKGSGAGSLVRADQQYCISRQLMAIRPRNWDARFLYYSLQQNSASIKEASAGLIPGLSRSDILDQLLPIPSASEEQRSIAAALQDSDDLIATIERLIAKKQAIKQGMMQQLLTGRSRLPGFGSRWAPVRLGDAGGTFGGLTGKSKDDFGNGSEVFVTFMEVMAGARLRGKRLERVNVGPAERQNRVLKGDVLFNGSSETPEELALAAVVDYNPSPRTYLNSFCFGYRLKRDDQIDPTYLAHFFRSSQGRDLVSVLAQGATRYNIAKTKLLQVAPILPPIEEQRAVVSVLSDVEAEMSVLDARLSKARAIKTGMMQQLLTGRTRLPVEAAS